MTITATVTPALVWGPAPETLMLGRDEVHVWRASLDQTASRVQNYLRTLTPDERRRAARFYFARDRDHFIVARGVLRAILSSYLNRDPGQLRFCYNPQGKPYLPRESGGDWLRFNLSHSHGLALLAVTRDREIGVDVEHIRSGLADEQMAERFFSPQEVAQLRALPPARQAEAFFNCWTRKEAYIKAQGVGLSLPLDQFDVSLVPGEPAALLSTRGDPHEASRWSLRELMPGSGYIAALAVKGHDWRLTCWQWADL
jgi:4'-phosphopantetheinyl transferase